MDYFISKIVAQTYQSETDSFDLNKSDSKLECEEHVAD